MSRKIELAEIEDLYLNQDYVFLVTDAGYDKNTKNSIKDHYSLTTIEAQKVKKNPLVQEMIKNSGNIEIVDSRATTSTTTDTQETESTPSELAEAMI